MGKVARSDEVSGKFMTRQRHLRGGRCGLLCLSLVLASAAHAQPEPPPAVEAPPVAAPGAPPPGYVPPPVYPVSGPNPDPEAPGYVRAPGAETHDGFYLRLNVGPGYTRLSTSTMGSDLSIAGLDEVLGVALGGAINRHVIIYGTLVGSAVRNPTSKNHGPLSSNVSDGMLVGTVTVGGYGDAGAVGFGAGAAYYLDSNVFFAGSLLASRLFVDGVSGGVAAKTDWGFTFEGLVGKEWWVSDNWGLGVAGQLLLGAMQDHPYANESVPTWQLTSFSVLFTASYN